MSFLASGQIDSVLNNSLEIESALEDFLQNEESESFDFNTLNSHLENLLRHPINLNKASESDLTDLGILSDAQILHFLKYRNEVGALISEYELQAIPSFDLNTIQKILPFVTVKTKSDNLKSSVLKMITEGENQLFLRWSRNLQKADGYLSSDGKLPKFQGDPNRFYVRFKHAYGTKLSFGITAEKDPGEEFFKGSNKNGFDFYSAHLYIRDLSDRILAFTLGDYTLNLGQGLIVRTGFTTGKSALTMNIKRTNRVLERYSSVNEIDFMRGAAATIRISEKMEFTPFFSYRKIDGNQVEILDLESELEESAFSSIQNSGLHRTLTEIEDKNAIGKTTLGGSLKFKNRSWHVAANSVFNRFDRPLFPRQRLDNQFGFSGQQLLNLSLDYSFLFRNINFFGETAMGDNGAIASSNGMLIALDKKLSLAFLFRHFPRNYHHINAQPFAEKRRGTNETGLYLGLEMRPFKDWKINAYFDFWEHPWLTFQNEAPSVGHEWLARLTYYKRRKLEFYFQIRGETKDSNLPENLTKTDIPIQTDRFQTRFHLTHILSKRLTLRSRLDLGTFKESGIPIQKGISMYQDVVFRPIRIPFSFTTRFSIFDTDSYDVRYYNYENDLLYNFSIPAYYNEGTRFYFNIRYRGIRNLMIEARYAQTYWNNQVSFGSGDDEISGQIKSEVKMQIRYRF